MHLNLSLFFYLDLEQKQKLFEAQSAQNMTLEETIKQKNDELSMLNVAITNKKKELTTIQDSLKDAHDQQVLMEATLRKLEEDKKTADQPAEPAAEGASASQPAQEMVEHLEAQNRKLHASFEAMKKEIAQMKEELAAKEGVEQQIKQLTEQLEMEKNKYQQLLSETQDKQM